MILESSKKETPCFHRTISIHIDSLLSQCVTWPVSRRSDVALLNKSPPKTYILPVQPVIFIALKRKLPVSTDQFQFRLIVHYPRVSLNQFQDDLMLHYTIKALQIVFCLPKSSYLSCFIYNAGLNTTQCWLIIGQNTCWVVFNQQLG